MLFRSASNPNLAINSYFVGGGSQQGGGQLPINQKSQTSYQGRGYTIDGWLISNGSSPVTISDDCVTVTTGTAGTAFNQTYEPGYLIPGEVYTFSALGWSDNGDFAVQAHTGDDFLTEELSGEEPGTIGVAATTFRASADKSKIPMARIRSTAAGIVLHPIAAKLEHAPIQTLAHREGDTWVLNDPPPNPVLELLKCQRYQFELFDRHLTGQGYVVQGKATTGTSIFGLLPTPVTMREGGLPSLITDCSASNPYRAFGIFQDGYSNNRPITEIRVDRKSVV